MTTEPAEPLSYSTQTHCPEPGCLSVARDPGALGWFQIVGVWWCPMHAAGGARRIQRQYDEIDWYDGNIRLRERVIASADADKQHEFARATAAGLSRKDPAVRRRTAEIDDRASRAQDELAVLQRNRAAALARHELENESYLNNIREIDGGSEEI